MQNRNFSDEAKISLLNMQLACTCIIGIHIYSCYVTSHTKTYTNGYPLNGENKWLINGWETNLQSA